MASVRSGRVGRAGHLNWTKPGRRVRSLGVRLAHLHATVVRVAYSFECVLVQHARVVLTRGAGAADEWLINVRCCR